MSQITKGKYFEITAFHIDLGTEVMFGSFDRDDCKYELEAERDGWKDEGWNSIKIVSRETTETPDPEVYDLKVVPVTVVLQNEQRSINSRPSSVHSFEVSLEKSDPTTIENHIFESSNHPARKRLWKDRSLSVGDLVIYEGKTMRCESSGWTDINSAKCREAVLTIQFKMDLEAKELAAAQQKSKDALERLAKGVTPASARVLLGVVKAYDHSIECHSMKLQGFRESLELICDGLV